MKKKSSRYCSLYLMKKIEERLRQPGLSDFERVALKSRYWDIVEGIREKASHE